MVFFLKIPGTWNQKLKGPEAKTILENHGKGKLKCIDMKVI